MAGVGGKVATKFRDTYKFVNKEVVHWFPGHMRKGLKQMEQQLKNVDCVVEVHDARVPLSGRFTEYRNTVGGLKPHIFVLNKEDLADRSREYEIRARLGKDGLENVIYTCSRDQTCPGFKKLLPLAKDLISKSNRYNRSENEEYTMLVIGVPNVGKSSVINRLRNKYLRKAKASPVGAVPGITRSLLTRIKISKEPPIYLLDTPGILEPQVRNVETGMKLAVVNCLQDHLVGPETIADYLLYWLNKQKRFEYVEKLGLVSATDDILQLLTIIAVSMHKRKRFKNYDGRLTLRPDFRSAAEHFLKLFRTGELGLVCLDDDLLNGEQEKVDDV